MDAAHADQPGAGRAGRVTLAVVVQVPVGVVGLFVAFLFAYGFADRVTVGMHVFFVVAVASVGAVAALVSVPAFLGGGRPLHGALSRSCLVALVLYPLALALGTVVSLLNEDQGSVTADQPDWPFVLVVVAGLLVSGASAAGLRRHLAA